MPYFVERIIAILGRLCLSVIFLTSGVGKIFSWSDTAQAMHKEGMVAVPVFLVLAIVFEIVGGLSVLFGYRARLGALLLIAFLIPVTLIFHDFWQYQGTESTEQMSEFMKNVALLGGLLLILAFGARPLRFDEKPRH